MQIRELVPPGSGTYLVVDTSADVLSFAYPVYPPTTVTIVHKHRPTDIDLVPINPDGKKPYPTLNTMVRRNGSLKQLITVSSGFNPLPVETFSATLSSNSQPRVEKVSPDVYSDFNFSGIVGGPTFLAYTLNMQLAAGKFLLRVGDARVPVQQAPSGLNEGAPFYSLLAANPDYWIVGKGFTREEVAGPLEKDSVDRVLHRSSGLWSEVAVDGSFSRQRICGNWLMIIVQYWYPGNQTNPGREVERQGDRASQKLPPVQSLYAGNMGGHSRIPGKLQIINLKDGRRFEIQTHMEDSEVLTTTNNRVLYRVNDAIYECMIEGSKLAKPSLVVQDSDIVPEIHWAFLADTASLPPPSE